MIEGILGHILPADELAIEEDYFRKLTGESPRGMVLIAASDLDTAMKSLLEAHLFGSRTRIKLLKDGEGPIGSMIRRAEFLYVMGIISKDDFQLIKQLSEIRNKCAHNSDNFTINDIENQLGPTGALELIAYSLGDHDVSIVNKYSIIALRLARFFRNLEKINNAYQLQGYGKSLRDKYSEIEEETRKQLYEDQNGVVQNDY